MTNAIPKKVAIAGYGAEGEANYRYWTGLGADITIFDEANQPSRPLPEGARTRLGTGVLGDMNGFDLVIRTAGLNPNHITTDGKIWSATNEFFSRCPAPIIGVTGTKGKGTTCTLIAEILKAAGKTVHLVGNIGTPALEVLPAIKAENIVVFELSSFQLWDIERSPETAVVLMIEQDHLNVHKDMAEYVAAKAHIGTFQTPQDLLVYHPTNERSAQVARVSAAEKKRYMTPEGAQAVSDHIEIEGNIICDISEVGLIGAHNIENICAAVTAAWRYTQDLVAIKQAVTTFKGLPHRLEFVREVGGAKYFDDSYSANPAATVAALSVFVEPIVALVGGFDRKADFTKLVDAIVASKNLKKLVLMGETAHKISQLLEERGFTNMSVQSGTNFADIVTATQAYAEPGDIVLLSPGCPSFDMFKNFEERGNEFKAIVRSLT